jgi:hypothetical protein
MILPDKGTCVSGLNQQKCKERFWWQNEIRGGFPPLMGITVSPSLENLVQAGILFSGKAKMHGMREFILIND